MKRVWFNAWLEHTLALDERAESFSEFIDHSGDETISGKAPPRKWKRALLLKVSGKEGERYQIGYTYLNRQVSKISLTEREVGQGPFAIRIPPAEFGPFSFFVVSLTGIVKLEKLLWNNDFCLVSDPNKKHIPLFTPKIYADSS